MDFDSLMQLVFNKRQTSPNDDVANGQSQLPQAQFNDNKIQFPPPNNPGRLTPVDLQRIFTPLPNYRIPGGSSGITATRG